MDELEIEKGYANFHRKLNRILRQKEVKAFKAHVAAHPMQAGRLSHCLGLSDKLAEVEMYKAIVVRSALRDLHPEAVDLLKKKGIDFPATQLRNRGRGRRNTFRRKKGG
ncbi:MAG: hypothetical protein JRJ77_16675 [Deltaproteobacteria bacterium]|nr:hypothetical protein [Deltaproteobacteria bacterium]MBW2342185.1 hypothetical protein [Deltaproteobacteria bacterium]